MFVERPGYGIAMRTAEYAAIPPLLLNGGMTEVLSGAGLSQYFLAQNNVFTGFDQAQYLQTGRIPDGQYRIGFQVVDAQRSEVKLSNLTYSQPGWFLLNDPPQLNLPRNNVTERVNDPQSIKLEWFPRHLGSMNSAFATSYQVELFALRVPGINPQQVALSLPPDYTTITNQTSFMLTQDKYLLEPGVEYAWRVKAMAGDGFTLFQNNGYSEVFSFVYGQLCPTPEKTEALPTGTESAEISWETDPKQSSYIIRYRLKSEEETIWHQKESYSSSTEIAHVLSPGTAYEYQVKAKCTTTESEYSPIKTFSTQQLPPVNFECGKTDETSEITNFTPKLELKPGEIIYNGKFPVKITKIEGAAGSFNGEGRMRIPMLANIQINMKFTGLKVNEENQVFGGEMVSIYNEDSPFFIEDLSDYRGEGDQVGNVITGQDSAAIILTYEVTDPGDLNITVNGDNVTITNGGNTTYVEVDDAGSGTTIVDSGGNIFSVDVDKNGNTTVTQVGTSGGSTTSGSDYNTNAGTYNQLDNKTTVTFYNNGKWAFDERNPKYEGSVFDSEYEKIGDYYVPWKLVPLGKADKIKARVTSGTIEDPEKLKFLTPTGTEFFAEYKNGEYLLEVIGAKERDGIELYAIYMPDDTTKISVGKLKIASYPRLDRNVKLVPMGDFHIDGIISEDILNEIYNPYYIHWHVNIDKVFDNTDWDTNEKGLQATGSEFYSMFTPEMRALNAAFKEERGVDEESLYLFIFPDGNSEGNLMGDMPLKSRFGYIFNADGADTRKITQTVAHELGHGAFQLKHTFSEKYNIKQNTTQNLMDYDGGIELVKYQWDVVHDPQNKLFNWMQGEEEGQMEDALNDNLTYWLEPCKKYHDFDLLCNQKPLAKDEKYSVELNTKGFKLHYISCEAKLSDFEAQKQYVPVNASGKWKVNGIDIVKGDEIENSSITLKEKKGKENRIIEIYPTKEGEFEIEFYTDRANVKNPVCTATINVILGNDAKQKIYKIKNLTTNTIESSFTINENETYEFEVVEEKDGTYKTFEGSLKWKEVVNETTTDLSSDKRLKYTPSGSGIKMIEAVLDDIKVSTQLLIMPSIMGCNQAKTYYIDQDGNILYSRAGNKTYLIKTFKTQAEIYSSEYINNGKAAPVNTQINKSLYDKCVDSLKTLTKNGVVNAKITENIQNSFIEIECSHVLKELYQLVSANPGQCGNPHDDGKGGPSVNAIGNPKNPHNNIEYGGTVDFYGNVTEAQHNTEPSNPKEDENAFINISKGATTRSSFHSHPSGSLIEYITFDENNDGKPDTDNTGQIIRKPKTYSFVQAPSNIDQVNFSLPKYGYVFAMGSKDHGGINVYVYDANGIIGFFNFKLFKNPEFN